MAIFPPGRSLIVPPSQLWSRGKTVTVDGGTKAKYPPTRATDGRSGLAMRSEFTTEVFNIDLEAARTPNVFGVIHNNITRGLVCAFQASSSAWFGSLLLDRGAGASYPNFWLDLRGFPATAQYWRLGVTNSAKPISIGELVIGTGFEFNGTLRTLPGEEVTYWQERQMLEYGKVAISASGALSRVIALDLTMTAAEAANLEQIAIEAMASGEPVVVVPDTLRNELFFVHWPDDFALRYPQSAVQVTASLQLLEEGAGVV